MTHSITHLDPKQQYNAQRLMKALINGELSPSPAWRKIGFRIKFLLRSLTHFSVTRALLDGLSHHPLLITILTAQPALPYKLHRPYLSTRLSKQDNQAALLQHYEFVQVRMPQTLLHGSLNPQPYVIVELQGKGEHVFRIAIHSIDRLNKEGELTLLFLNADNVMLAEVTFLLMFYQQKATLFIGGLQGARANIPHSEIQQATKQCHGLFPKRLIIESACCLARYLGIEQIIAVGNDTHIYQNWRYQRKKKLSRHADYDAFWISLGASQLPDQHYQLPLQIVRKSTENIQSKKRAEYQRRYQLLDQLENGFSRHFN